jgi:Ca2+/Na+ antiporter
VLLLAGGGLVLGFSLVLDDASSQGEMFDGLGLAIGGMIAGTALVAGALCVVAMVLAERRWPVARVLGVVLSLVVAAVAFPLGKDSPWTLLVLAFALLLLLVAALPRGADR